MIKFLQDLFADIRARIAAALLAVLSSLLPPVQRVAIETYQWIVSTETRALTTSGILFVLGVLVLWFAFFRRVWRLGKGVRGTVRRIFVGMREYSRQQDSPVSAADNIKALEKMAKEAGERFDHLK